MAAVRSRLCDVVRGAHTARHVTRTRHVKPTVSLCARTLLSMNYSVGRRHICSTCTDHRRVTPRARLMSPTVPHSARRRLFSTTSATRASAPVVPESVIPSYNVVRFVDVDGNESYGTLETDESPEVPVLEKVYYARPIQQMEERHRWARLEERARVARFLPPIEPVTIYCMGLNYHQHAVETGLAVPKFPITFLKPITSVVGHRHEIVIPKVASDPAEVDFEGELAVVIGRDCKNVSPEEALDYVLGYTIANDVSARRWQGRKGGGQWSRAKSFDTFCPLGPGVVPANRVDPDQLRITTTVNGEVFQDSCTSDMVFSVAEMISFLSQDTTLLHGTIILTGTPEGVGFTRSPPQFLRPGDLVEVSIEGLGTLSNPVVAEPSSSSDWV